MALIELPPELLLRVSTFLTTSELGKLRLTSKHVEAVLFDNFAREFFTKKQFMLEQVSLQALIDISNHPTLSSRLSEVVISTHVLPSDSEIFSSFGKAMYEAAYVSHDVLLASGQALHMLSNAFSRLPNLRTVGLRDYNGRGRDRDGETACWKSWGWSFAWEGMPTYDPADPYYQRALNNISPEHVLPMILYALGHAKVSPEGVHVFLRKRARLSQQSFNVLDGYLGEKVRPVLGDMKELMLAIGNDTPARAATTNIPLSRLLQHTPKIETLRLNFDSGHSFGSRFLKWLGTPISSSLAPTTSPAIDSVSLPRLTALELGTVNVPAAVLLKVLTKFDLESFSLWKVILHASSTNEDSWKTLLHNLANKLPEKTRLKTVLIGFPAQMHGHDYHFGIEDPCMFKPVGAREKDTYDLFKLRHEVKHHAGPGTSIKDWLEELSRRTHVQLPEDSDSASDTIQSELEDGEGEDEDDDDEDHDDGDD